jgi:hypothetical protein
MMLVVLAIFAFRIIAKNFAVFVEVEPENLEKESPQLIKNK